MIHLAQIDQVAKLAKDAAEGSDRFVIFLMMGLCAVAGTAIIVTLYKAFIKQTEAQMKQQDAHAQFVMTVYTEGVKSQAILNVTIQDCTECLTKVKQQLEEYQRLVDKLQAKLGN